MTKFSDISKRSLIKILKKSKIRKISGSTFDKNLIGKCVGSGVEGIVYNYGKSRIIKFASLDSDYGVTRGSFNRTMKWLKKHPKPEIARVYSFGIFMFNGELISFYTAEKLSKTVKEWHINYREWYKFIKQIPYDYSDLHSGNIMKDKRGNQKIIDLTAFCWNYD